MKACRRVRLVISGVLALVLLGGCAAIETGPRAPERVFTNPVHRWSVTYSADWKVNSTQLGNVRIHSPSGDGLCGLHSRAARFKTVDEFADFAQASSERFFKDRGVRVQSSPKQRITLPNGVIGVDVLTEILSGGRSRRIYVLADTVGYMIDCETEVANWGQLEPFFARIITSFTLGKAVPSANVTLVNSKTGETVTCPTELPREGLATRMITREQAAQQMAWHAEFQRTHNRLPTPLEGCIKGHEIRGFVRKPE